MRLTVKLLQIKARKLRYTLVVCGSAKYKYILYYGSGNKKIVAFISNTIEPVFQYLQTVEKAREEQPRRK